MEVLKMEKLTNINGLEVFRNNEKLRQRVWEDALENDAYYQADEILSYFRHYNEITQKRYETLRDYEIDYCTAYVKPDYNNLRDFFEDCINVANIFGLFDDMHNIKNVFNRILEKIDLFEDVNAGYCEMSNNRYANLEKWIIENAREAAEYIANYAQEAYTQFDDENILEDYYLTIWLDYNENLEVDEKYQVYETITRII
jgi:hypothetical protein